LCCGIACRVQASERELEGGQAVRAPCFGVPFVVCRKSPWHGASYRSRTRQCAWYQTCKTVCSQATRTVVAHVMMMRMLSVLAARDHNRIKSHAAYMTQCLRLGGDLLRRLNKDPLIHSRGQTQPAIGKGRHARAWRSSRQRSRASRQRRAVLIRSVLSRLFVLAFSGMVNPLRNPCPGCISCCNSLLKVWHAALPSMPHHEYKTSTQDWSVHSSPLQSTVHTTLLPCMKTCSADRSHTTRCLAADRGRAHDLLPKDNATLNTCATAMLREA